MQKETKAKKKIQSNKEIKKKKFQDQGITLIALVITIVILLILTGVALNAAIGENGLFQRARLATEKYKEAEDDEQRKMTMYEAVMNTKSTEYVDKNGDEAIIPAGFAVSEVEGENTINEGLVIIDAKGNEFVWVPVPVAVGDVKENDIIKYKENDTPMATQVKLEKSSASPQYAGVSYGGVDDSIDYPDSLKVRYCDLTSEISEPRLVTGVDNIEYDGVEKNCTSAGVKGGKEEFKKQMYSDYNEMVESVKKYGGFYVARYEMSLSEDKKAQYKKGEISNYRQTWYEYYKIQREFADGNSVKSSMIWGSQFDAMVIWFLRTGTNVKLSCPDGKVRNDKRITGIESMDVINNVYDLLGNSYEWTLEARCTSKFTSRSARGGDFELGVGLTDRGVRNSDCDW